MESDRRKEAVNWIALGILMIFYGGTWVSPHFYHVTEIYNSSIVFVACVLLFFNNVKWWQQLKSRNHEIYLLGAILLLAVVNLFLIGSNKGCILILADFLLIFYMCNQITLTKLQIQVFSVLFLLIFLVWFCYDLAFSYNSNTGATVTVFSLICAMILLTKLTEKKEILGIFIVIAMLRTVNLVMWHLARGAFIALFLFLIFYYVVPKKWWANKKLYTFLCVFACFGSLLFVLLYVSLSQTGYNLTMPFFYKNLFSGREKIWSEVFQIFRQHPLTGIGSGYKLESFFEYNIHNAMYDLLAVHGIPVFMGTIYFVLKRLLEAFSCIAGSKVAICAASGLFAIFIESFIDMDLVWANYAPVLLFLLLTIFYSKKTEKINPAGE